MEDSTKEEWVEENEFIPLIRWTARILGAVIAGFSLAMFIGEFLDQHPHAHPAPIHAGEVIGLTLAGTYVAAMFLAFKWERAGALIGGGALGCLAVALALSGADPTLVLVFAGPVLLYLLCWYLEYRDSK